MEPLPADRLRALILEWASQLKPAIPTPENPEEEPLYVRDVKTRAERQGVSPEIIYGQDQAVIDQSTYFSSDCLKPDEVLLLFSDPGKLEVARLDHLESCLHCRVLSGQAVLTAQREQTLVARLSAAELTPELPSVLEPSRLARWMTGTLASLNNAPEWGLRWGAGIAMGAALVLLAVNFGPVKWRLAMYTGPFVLSIYATDTGVTQANLDAAERLATSSKEFVGNVVTLLQRGQENRRRMQLSPLEQLVGMRQDCGLFFALLQTHDRLLTPTLRSQLIGFCTTWSIGLQELEATLRSGAASAQDEQAKVDERFDNLVGFLRQVADRSG